LSRLPPVLRIAIPTPLRRSFDYLPPPGTDIAQLQPGVRLRVPFGRNEVIGVLLELRAESELGHNRLKQAKQLLDAAPLLTAELMDLLTWGSRYYQHPVGEVMALALPALLRKGGEARVRGVVRWQLSDEGRALDPHSLRRAPRQVSLMLQLQNAGQQSLGEGELAQDGETWRPVMARLLEKGWVQKITGPCLPLPNPDTHQRPLVLNPGQQHAFDTVNKAWGRYETFLLDGITGSGKTEVYLRLIEQALTNKQQTLLLVPEIGLTPQLLARFRQRLATPIAVLHSGLSDQERLCAWLAAARGEAGVVIGTRSALFTPLANPGLFIIDEEHDLSYKQQDGFRYSARDLTLKRARQLAVPVLLGSATPALESLLNCQRQRYTRLHLDQRAGNARPPTLQLLDVRGQKMQHGLSAQLIHSMQQHLQQGNQVMVFINRRGFAPVLMCHQCGWHARCDRCDAHMTIHQQARRQRCHHCGSERPLPTQCPECGHDELLHMGYGTERVEQALTERFPDFPVLRIDRDTTRRKGAMQAMLEQIQQGEACILVGTQMLAKGHHFPGLTLVALLDSDYGLFSADFRAAERLGQLVLQVAGRAGREGQQGEVLLQTHHPDSPLLQTLLRQDYGRFAQNLLQEREITRLPPFSHFALLRAEAVDPQLPMQFLQQAHAQATTWLTNASLKDIEIYRPLPAPMERRAGRSRAQLLLQARDRGALQKLLEPWLQHLETLKSARKVRWSIDVDPLEMF